MFARSLDEHALGEAREVCGDARLGAVRVGGVAARAGGVASEVRDERVDVVAVALRQAVREVEVFAARDADASERGEQGERGARRAAAAHRCALSVRAQG